MVIKTFKFSNKDLKYFYDYDSERDVYNKVLSLSNAREVLINRYILLVKDKIATSLQLLKDYDDNNIEVKITVFGNTVQYDIIFSGIDSLPEIDPTEFKVQ